LKLAYINLFERKNFQFAAAIQYSSQMEEKTARQFISVKSQSIIIEEGIDINRFLNLSASGCFRSKHSEMSNKVLVLFLGRFHQKKGLELLIYAFAAVSERCPKAHLVLAGSGDLEYVSSLIQIISDLGLTNCSTVTGQLSEDDKLSALADSDLFVLPSHGENFGIAVVEAMASGLPVLISDKVGIWPTVVESDAGIVTVCDAAKIADAIVLIVNNPDLREKLGRNGRILAQRQFSLDRMAEKMEIEYCKLRSTSS
jgi:glycosyltransferase involved in cell wall biosynthesis